MCGICGVYNFGTGAAAGETELRRMNALLVHRGPDDEGFRLDGPVGIAMRRLSIIDLSTGHQPISNEDGTIWIVFNGEIYNFPELRAYLESRGHVFRTKTDTEAIIHLYEEHGRDCVKKLRGMFAFAIWDAPKKRLFAARDRVGKKPLCYFAGNGRFVFASELRSVMAADGVPKELDPRAVDMFLSLQYIPAPRTIYKGVRKLPPAHTLTVESGRVSVEPYWDLPLDEERRGISLSDARSEIRRKLTEAVKIRMIADVPLGAFLSGGVDSSIIVALMSRLSDRPVKTFSVGFAEQEFCELDYARELAQMYGCDHHEFIVRPEMAEVLPKLAWHYSEPYADASALPSYYVARETRKHVTVALNGDGGDENFAGYLRYVAMKLAHYWDYLPVPMQKAISASAELLPEKNAPFGTLWRAKRFLRSAVFSDFPSRHLKMVCYFSEEDKRPLYSKTFMHALGEDLSAAKNYIGESYSKAAGLDFVNQLLYVDMKTYLPEDLMVKMDIACMANSLEGRSPLLDHEFMELCFGLKGDWKLCGVNRTKWILKETFRDMLPDTIRKRGKMGFGIPLGPWFRVELKKYWEEHCLSPKALSRGYFDESALRALWTEHQTGKRDHGYRLWALLMLELWHETFLPDGRILK
ncbi:MAG: asparagine synthase (glutamine-hydrolyzing) [Elusimicrobiales bacterium]|nr:asparagine synthase (glutamine-hydrolyzing) [Elusimicrobiales bacterium]